MEYYYFISFFGKTYGQDILKQKWIIKKDSIRFEIFENNKNIIYNVVYKDSGLYFINGLYFYKGENIKASFVGGKDSLNKYIIENLSYLPYNRVYPKILIGFIIDNKGRILYPGILRGVEDSYNKAALNLVKNMPNWEPARKGKDSVASFNIIGIDFTIK